MRQPEDEKDPIQETAPEGAPSKGGEGNELAERLAKLEKENEEHKRKINELSGEKSTLEKRLTEREKPAPRGEEQQTQGDDLDKEIASALEEAIVDPEKAAKKLGQTIRNSNTQSKKEAATDAIRQFDEKVSWERHVERVRSENADLVKHEKRISQDAANLLRSGQAKTAEEALEKSITSFRDEFGIKKPEKTPDAPAEKPVEKAPKGALGETGNTAPRKNQPVTDDEGGDSPEDYVAMRKRLVAQRGA